MGILINNFISLFFLFCSFAFGDCLHCGFLGFFWDF